MYGDEVIAKIKANFADIFLCVCRFSAGFSEQLNKFHWGSFSASHFDYENKWIKEPDKKRRFVGFDEVEIESSEIVCESYVWRGKFIHLFNELKSFICFYISFQNNL